MATTSPSHLPTIDPHLRGEAGRELQATLLDLVDLALTGKQLHWSVVGPNFRPLHLQLDELVDSWHELADAVAERAVAIGTFPDGQAGAVAARSLARPLRRARSRITSSCTSWRTASRRSVSSRARAWTAWQTSTRPRRTS